MKYLLMIALSVLMTGSAAEAHNRDRHRPQYYHGPGHVLYTPWGVVSTVPNRIRITKHCVYKPWKNKTVCRY